MLRFLHKQAGPIVRLTTTSFGSNGRFKYSFAKLSPSICKDFRKEDTLAFGGSGWSESRLVSQERAITEAIERWAFKSFLDSEENNAKLDLDSTTNGFSAFPSNLPIALAYSHSYCECIERHLLSRFADDHSYQLHRLDSVCDETALFELQKGRLISFYTSIEVNPSYEHLDHVKKIYFVISMFLIEGAGLVAGTAASENLINAHQKSLQECYVHFLAASKLRVGPISDGASITDKRLKNFAENHDQATILKDRAQRFCMSNLTPEIPKVIFCEELFGPWNPEFNIVRVLLEGTQSITAGTEWRFVI